MNASGTAVQFLARGRNGVLCGKFLASFCGHDDEVCCVGKVVGNSQRLTLGRGSRFLDASDLFKRHASKGEPPRNTMCSLAFQRDQVHQLLETDIDIEILELLFHDRHCGFIVIVKVCHSAYASKGLCIAVQLWCQMCRIECSHGVLIPLASPRLPACNQQGNTCCEKCCDCRRPRRPCLTFHVRPTPRRPTSDCKCGADSDSSNRYGFWQPVTAFVHYSPVRAADGAWYSNSESSLFGKHGLSKCYGGHARHRLLQLASRFRNARVNSRRACGSVRQGIDENGVFACTHLAMIGYREVDVQAVLTNSASQDHQFLRNCRISQFLQRNRRQHRPEIVQCRSVEGRLPGSNSIEEFSGAEPVADDAQQVSCIYGNLHCHFCGLLSRSPLFTMLDMQCEPCAGDDRHGCCSGLDPCSNVGARFWEQRDVSTSKSHCADSGQGRNHDNEEKCSGRAYQLFCIHRFVHSGLAVSYPAEVKA